MKYLEYFAKNLKIFRQKKKLTQAQLAEQLNVHPSTVARIETAQHQASAATIDKLIKILGVSYGQFFDYYEANENNQKRKDLTKKINVLLTSMSNEDLNHFLISMESYLSTQMNKKEKS